MSNFTYEPRFTLNPKNWEDFKHFINENYPKPSFTHEQKEFVHRYLKQDDGTCGDLNRLWINIFSDQLIDVVEHGLDYGTLGEQLERLQAYVGKAILGFFNCQHTLRPSVPHALRSHEQNRMLEVHPNIVNFPTDLAIEMGRILELTARTNQDKSSKDPNERVEDQRLFHTLYMNLQEMHREGSGAEGDGSSTSAPRMERAHSTSTESTAGSAAAFGDWYPHGAEDTFMRLCTYRIWSEKYEQENEWSPGKMLGPWLREAIQLYNNVSYHWPSCKIKKYDLDSRFSAIQYTAKHTWLPDSLSRVNLHQNTKKPMTNWITDWCTYPVSENRHVWENYYCCVIFNAHNLSRLLNKKEGKHTADYMEAEEGEGHAAKKMKTGAGEAMAKTTATEEESNTPEYRLLKQALDRIQRMEAYIVQIDRNAASRHHDSLREMNGHFGPIRNQLLHLNQGQANAYQLMDRILQQK